METGKAIQYVNAVVTRGRMGVLSASPDEIDALDLALVALQAQVWRPLATALSHERIVLSDGYCVIIGEVWDGDCLDDDGRRLTRVRFWQPLPVCKACARIPGAPRGSVEAE